LVLAGVAIVVCDSHVVRDHAAIERQRRAECDEAAQLLRVHLRRVKTLRDVSLADFLRLSEKLPPLLRRRTRHVVTENVRVLQTVAAVRAEDPVAIGGRLNESHDSLRDDYDISSPELDLLVGAARSLPGVFGSRMTGRSGATVSLVRRDALPAFRSTLGAAYRSAFGREPAVLEVRAADGASIIG
jgi:galactokinase